MTEKKSYFGWFEKKISKNTGKEYGSGSFNPQNIQDLVELSKKNSKGYVNFFWNIYQDKPSITLCEPRDGSDNAKQNFSATSESIEFPF